MEAELEVGAAEAELEAGADAEAELNAKTVRHRTWLSWWTSPTNRRHGIFQRSACPTPISAGEAGGSVRTP